MTVYFISGLGADKRAFKRLKLPDKVQVRHIDWIEPLDNESLPDYCKRLSNCIDTSEQFIIIGLSFGGMVAIELARSLRPKQTILISSISTRQELPLVFKLAGYLGLHKLIPSFWLKKPKRLINWFFGATTAGERRLFQQFLSNTSPIFLKWAIDKILNWQNEQRPSHLFHVHGTDDRIFPIKLSKADVKIEGGRHFMVYSKADVISSILNERLNRGTTDLHD